MCCKVGDVNIINGLPVACCLLSLCTYVQRHRLKRA
jgi:hypothetical protein